MSEHRPSRHRPAVLLRTLVTGLMVVGCSSPSAEICYRADDCGVIGNLGIDECALRIEDGVDDRRLSDRDVDDCANCVGNPEHSCAELFSDCARACGEVYAEILLGDGR